jgi:hypothetical protein
MRTVLVLPLILTGVAPAGERTLPSPPAGADAIVAHMLEADRARTPLLAGYTAIRHYILDNKRFGTHASMTVRVTFRAPDVKQFEILEQSGPGAVRSQVFRRMLDSELDSAKDGGRGTKISPDNYSFQLAGERLLEGRKCYVLDAAPKTRNRYLFRGKVWVDAQDWAVVRIEGSPAKNPSFWVRKTAFVHSYKKFGPFWLAVSNQSDTDVLVFGHTQVRIEYSDYEITSAAFSL